MCAFTRPGRTSFPLASRTRSNGPGIFSAGAIRAMRSPSMRRACRSRTRQGSPRVTSVPFRIRSRIVSSVSRKDVPGSGEADLGVELLAEPVEDDDLVLEELAPVLRVPLGLDLLVGLPLLLDPRVVLEVVDRLAVHVRQLLEVVDGLPLEAPRQRPGRVDARER